MKSPSMIFNVLVHLDIPGALGIVHVLEQLHGSGECHHLGPAAQGDLAERSESARDVTELQTQRWREIS